MRTNAPPIPTGYQITNVNIEAPTKGLSMKKKLDRVVAISVPALITVIAGGLLAWAGYASATNVWQHWTTVKQTSTEVHFVSTGQYVHSTTTDIIISSLFGILWLAIAVGCAYWAEAWYRLVKKGH